LEPTPDIKAIYDHAFHLAYVVTLAHHQLSTDLHVKNTSSAPSDVIEFQALFHNYIRAPSKYALIYPLIGKSYYDKTETTEEGRQASKTEARDGVDVLKFTDSVYEDAGQQYEIKWPGGRVDVRTVSLKDLVVWNPQEEAGKKISDMEDGGW
jgi:glucose-6-phosphate 1-epimerase